MSAIIKLSDNIFRSRKVILEMLEDRGYDVSTYSNYTINDINLMLMNTKVTAEMCPLDILVSKTVDGETMKAYVKYNLNKWRQTNKYDKMIETIYETIISPTDTLILIHSDTVIFKPSKDNRIEEYINKMYIKNKYFIQIFGVENFLFNVSHHEIVPKHTIISKEEQRKMLKDNNIISVKNLPTIRREDPMAKYIGMKPGDICKIEFPNLSSGLSVKYRRCTAN